MTYDRFRTVKFKCPITNEIKLIKVRYFDEHDPYPRVILFDDECKSCPDKESCKSLINPY